MIHNVICAIDTSDLDVALAHVRRLSPSIKCFKIGHGLTLAHGLDVIDRIKEAGACRIFLDLKFHDIPNSVAVAVKEATKRGVWMMTVHLAGGPAMLMAAMEEAKSRGEDAPLVVGVSVLTSIDQEMLNRDLGVPRTIEDHMVSLSQMGMDCGIDGVVCSAHEVTRMRHELGREAVLVTPGIRLGGHDHHDQKRVGDAKQALEDGANYLVVGRALTAGDDVAQALEQLKGNLQPA